MKGMKAKGAVDASMSEIEPLVEFIACSEMQHFETANAEPHQLVISYDSLSQFAALFLSVRPETVEIMDKPEFFRVGEEYELECQSRGSKPAAEVTWYKGHVAYDPQLVSVRSKLCSFIFLHRFFFEGIIH